MTDVPGEKLPPVSDQLNMMITEACERYPDAAKVIYRIVDNSFLEGYRDSEVDHEKEPKFLITIKYPRGRVIHDPKRKKTGKCPFGPGECTDQTGEHHTKQVTQQDLGDAANLYAIDATGLQKLYESWGYHVTRIERVG